jgi:hypothetical protein
LSAATADEATHRKMIAAAPMGPRKTLDRAICTPALAVR